MAARLPPPPSGVGELLFRDPDGSVTVQLRLERCWSDQGLPDDASPLAQQDPISTGMQPRLERKAGAETCLWLGYRPGSHEVPGDTLLSYALLVEGQARVEGQDLKGLWYEDHHEIPRSWYRATGHQQGAQVSLTLRAAEADAAEPDTASLTGLLARSGSGA